MSTHITEDQLWQYLSEELLAERRLEIHAHLEDCSECTAIYELIQVVHTDLQSLNLEKASATFTTSVMGQIKVEKTLNDSVYFWTTWTKRLIFSTLILIFLLILSMAKQSDFAITDQLDYLMEYSMIFIFTALICWGFFFIDKVLSRKSRYTTIA